MTRINIIEPVQLTDQHLMAEYRELPMVHASLRRSLRTKMTREVLAKVPKNYTLNAGHVTFFYDKMFYLRKRYDALIEELKTRGYNLDESRALDESGIPADFFKNEWMPGEDDLPIMQQRLQEKLKMKVHFYKYYGDGVWNGFYGNVSIWRP